ncbi:hypothetical protein LTR78_004183 [Recurvomyces mirabilis]|uniref:Uncharacterized protein n=1 Tax=Recurvomyces mirabilis TaxID=574656 RepID=A0AAE0WQI6_9PEZI|nr:hypothetical protein LTR78_004183 [Recurvomyces mirabilis]KAK5153646.1 hypothetical protein LTS14_007340 [Recurvomyces mirabilis]
MGISAAGVVALIIVGVAVGVGLAWGMYITYKGKRDGGHQEEHGDPQQEQSAYMREVRLRNQEVLAGSNGTPNYNPHHRSDEGRYSYGYDHSPSSMQDEQKYDRYNYHGKAPYVAEQQAMPVMSEKQKEEDDEDY